MKKLFALLVILFLLLSSLTASAEEPRREDVGDLIVLHLYGSYREMGRQQAELLGPDLRQVYDYQIGNYKRMISEAGAPGWFFNQSIIRLHNALGPLADNSGFHEENAGMAAVLGVPRRNVLRALLSLSGGSTVFAATRSATADGQAIIGRNVDWYDGFGRRRPVVAVYHPDGDDLDHIFVGWPLVGLPTAGLNEAGLAISFNFFVSDPQVSLCFPAWVQRLALQKATTVEEAIEIIEAPRRRGISAFLVLADATGDIAMVEFTPARRAVFRPENDWFGQANHARTPEMIPYDRYRHPDSFQRREAMENAVRPHVGELSPALAVDILRDRTGESYANASTVGNLSVMNPVVIHPASRTLWHSTTRQPHAPFGEYAPFTFDSSAERPTFAASQALTSERFEQERNEIRAARKALELHQDGKYEEALEAWEALLASDVTTLDPRRLKLGNALTHDALGNTQSAYDVLKDATEPNAPFDVRGLALVSSGILANRLGLRPQAIQHYEEALEHFAARPEFTAFDSVEETAKHGLENSRENVPLPISTESTSIPH